VGQAGQEYNQAEVSFSRQNQAKVSFYTGEVNPYLPKIIHLQESLLFSLFSPVSSLLHQLIVR
jgi:hypothetical protein